MCRMSYVLSQLARHRRLQQALASSRKLSQALPGICKSCNVRLKLHRNGEEAVSFRLCTSKAFEFSCTDSTEPYIDDLVPVRSTCTSTIGNLMTLPPSYMYPTVLIFLSVVVPGISTFVHRDPGNMYTNAPQVRKDLASYEYRWEVQQPFANR